MVGAVLFVMFLSLPGGNSSFAAPIISCGWTVIYLDSDYVPCWITVKVVFLRESRNIVNKKS